MSRSRSYTRHQKDRIKSKRQRFLKQYHQDPWHWNFYEKYIRAGLGLEHHNKFIGCSSGSKCKICHPPKQRTKDKKSAMDYERKADG